jgi:membrane fusion protein, multidrug efflux system
MIVGPTKKNLFMLLAILWIAISCTEDESAPETPGVTSITVAESESRDLSEAFTISSEVLSYKRVYIASRISGLIEEVHFEEGQFVRAGELMAQLDVRQQEVELNRALATLNEARDVFERTQALYETDAVSRAEFLTVSRDLEVAQSDVELLELLIEYGEIRAPMNAVVTARLVEVGNNVSENERMFTIADPDFLVIRPGVSELNLAGLDEANRWRYSWMYIRVRYSVEQFEEFSRILIRLQGCLQ